MSKDKKNTKSAVTDNRQKTLKLYSVGTIVILLVIVVAANILFDSILGKYLTFDFSLSNQNSISNETQDYLDSLSADTNIRVVGLMDRPTELNNTPLRYIVPLLDDYATKSGGKVTVEYVNPETYPSIRQELDREGQYDLTADTFAVCYQGKIVSISPYDCFTYDTESSSYGYYVPTANAVEYTFTNAMANLTSGFSAKAYFVTGVESDSSEQLKHILSSLGIDSADLPVSSSFTIPEDCNLIFINNPQTDIPQNVASALNNYISTGGDFIVAVNFYNNVSEQYPNLNSVLNEMNLNIDTYVVKENHPEYVLDNIGFEALVDIASNYTDFSSSSQLRSGYARPVRKYDNPYSYIKTDVVLTTSAYATAVKINEDGGQSQYENEDTYNVAMYATYEGMKDAPCCYVFGTSYFTSDEYISSYGYNDANVQFLRNCIRDITGMNNFNNLQVDSKPLDDYSFDSTKATASNASVMTVIFMIIIPLALVIAAAVVYAKRKNL
ncbi:ABC-type uncharacterized transport system [Ruminococcaceae bacterium YRB3002]|nr:ABC-type uncharacterized transport system [Ruminococcaceae bacterium YRB3002]